MLKMLKYVLALLVFVPEVTTAQIQFPDYVAWGNTNVAGNYYSETIAAMEEAGAAISEEVAADLMNTLDSIIENYPGDPVVPYAMRRKILLQQQVGAKSADDAAEALLTLANQLEDPRAAEFTRAFAAVTLFREQKVEEASLIYAGLSEKDVPEYTWFSFEVVKDYAKYSSSDVPVEGDPDFGKGRDSDKKLKHEYADFLVDEWLPSIETYMQESPSLSKLEKAQIVSSLEKGAHEVRRVLGPRIYMDVSERCTEEVYPLLLSIWKDALIVLGADNSLEPIEKHMNKINLYEEKIIPRIVELQDFQKNGLNPLTESSIWYCNRSGIGL